MRDQVRILARQARCALSGEPLGDYSAIEWDHIGERAITFDDSWENFQAVLTDPHDIKTNGTKATTAGSSKHKVAKVRRLASAEAHRWNRMMLDKREAKRLKELERKKPGKLRGRGFAKRRDLKC